MHTNLPFITTASCFTISATQQAELGALFQTYGGNLRAIVENFNWDMGSYTALENAYRNAEANISCTLVELPVSAYYDCI